MEKRKNIISMTSNNNLNTLNIFNLYSFNSYIIFIIVFNQFIYILIVFTLLYLYTIIKNIKTITGHTVYVNSLLHLKDGRVASCSDDNTIRIYDPSNDYHCVQVIERHSKGIESICQLDDGTIVSGSYDQSIMIGDYTIKSAHDGWIYKVITLPNNRIASCSKDMTIKIWKSNPRYSDIPIKVLEGHSDNVNSI